MTDAADRAVIDDDALLELYNRELIALSAEVAEPKTLPAPDARAEAVSIICGSVVVAELALDEAGRVSDFGYAVEACSLTRAVMAIVARHAEGKTRGEIAQGGEALRVMLEEGAAPPEGEWAELRIMAPAADYKARHESILLPFVAIDKAFDSISKGPKKQG